MTSIDLITCERHSAKLTAEACAKRAAWDSDCAGCVRGHALGVYGKYRCACGRRVKVDGTGCFLCTKGRCRPAVTPKKMKTASPSIPARHGPEPFGKCKRYEHRQKNKLGICSKCGEQTLIVGRGLGQNCYRYERNAGLLEQHYPPLSTAGRKLGKKGKNWRRYEI